MPLSRQQSRHDRTDIDTSRVVPAHRARSGYRLPRGQGYHRYLHAASVVALARLFDADSLICAMRLAHKLPAANTSLDSISGRWALRANSLSACYCFAAACSPAALPPRRNFTERIDAPSPAGCCERASSALRWHAKRCDDAKSSPMLVACYYRISPFIASHSPSGQARSLYFGGHRRRPNPADFTAFYNFDMLY